MNESNRTPNMPGNVGGVLAGECHGGIFVPVQKDGSIWPPEEALARGTAFPCLFDPWEKGEIYCE